MTRDPVLDHGMSRSRLLTNHAELMTIAFYSLQSGILDMANAVYSKSSSLHGKLLQAEHSEQFFNYV